MSSALFFAALAACNPAEPGVITVTVDGLTGADGLALISEARDAEEDRAVGYSCIPIDSDPFSESEPIRELIGETPCDNGVPLLLEPGLYDITTVTMMGGSQTPEACAYAEVEVDGDVEVEMPALGACE
ncbi:MAG: hypothetical protein JRJ84_16045 [Deltaproteobacteria bacterium]|nr:hypothetical protein [Deltaproteobacteria bacterium]